MRVRIFEEPTFELLACRLNEFLRFYKESEIFDIKYSGNGSTSHTYSGKYYSAMIILK